MTSSVSTPFGGVTVTIDPVRLAAYLNSADGPVLRHFMVLGDKVKDHFYAGIRSEFPRQFFAGRVLKRVSFEHDGPHVLVGVDRTRTDPHPIEGRPLLVFFWPAPKGPGRVVHLRHVNHPGSDFAPYVKTRLLEALAGLLATGGH